MSLTTWLLIAAVGLLSALLSTAFTLWLIGRRRNRDRLQPPPADVNILGVLRVKRLNGEQIQRVYVPSESRLLVGRDPDSAICIRDKAVSRRHLLVKSDGDKVFIEDLNSTNGSRLNGKRVTSVQPLVDMDVIEIGESRIVFMAHAAR